MNGQEIHIYCIFIMYRFLVDSIQVPWLAVEICKYASDVFKLCSFCTEANGCTSQQG